MIIDSIEAFPSQLCQGQSSQLSVGVSGGTGTYTYTWLSVPSGFASFQHNPAVSPMITTTYNLTVYDGIQSVSASVTVTVSVRPTANAGPDKTVQVGYTTTLNGSASGGSGNYTYSWTPSALLVNPAVQNPQTVAMSSTTTFQLVVTDNTSGCASPQDPVVVTVQGPLAINPSANPPVVSPGWSGCYQSNVTANVSGGSGNYVYTWSSNPPGISSGQSQLWVSPVVLTTYSVTVSDGISIVTGAVTVDYIPSPVYTVSSNSPVCRGATLQLSASGANTYHWYYGPQGFSSTQQNPSIPNIQSNQEGHYYIELTNLYGCKIWDSVYVTILPSPTATANSNSPVLLGGTLQLSGTATGGNGSNYSWMWTGPAAFTSNMANPTIPNAQAVNAGTYNLMATDGVCLSPVTTTDMIISSVPTVNYVPNQAFCNGELTPQIVFSGPYSGTSFTWTNDNTAIGLSSSGSGDISSFTTVNTGNSPIIANITVTPQANGFTGPPVSFSISVYPSPSVTSPTTANWCNNVSNTYTITCNSNSPNPSYAWARGWAPGVTPATANGTGASITETLVNSTTDPVVVHYLITPSLNGCNGTPFDLVVTVNPTSVITSATNANWCNNVSNTYNIISSSNSPTPSYSWARAAVPGITPATANGAGALITETLVNSTTNFVVVHYLITPTVNGCDGTPFNFAVTVNPTAVITSPGTANWCNNVSNSYNITSSTTPTPSYLWARAAVPGITPATASGTGALITETLVNSITNPVVVHYLITPTVNGCAGTPFNLAVMVNPTSVITSAPTANWCNNVSNSYNIISSTTPTPSYLWARAAVPGIIPVAANGTGASITETLVNSTTNYVVVHYLITPSLNGCTGTPFDLAVTVNPTAVITSPGTANWCNNVSNFYTTTSSSIYPTPWYSWARNAVPGISYPAVSSTGAIINETLVNTTTNPIIVHYLITPTLNGCAGTPFDLAVTVNPTAVITSPATANWCSNVQNTYDITSSSDYPTPIYSWARNAVPGISNPAISSTGASINEALVNTTTNPIIVHYLITPFVNGCSGTSFSPAVTVNPTPIASAGPDMTILVGFSTTLTGSASGSPGPFTFHWSPENLLINSNLQNPQTIPLVNNATFDLVVSDTNGCTSLPDQVAVSVLCCGFSVEAQATQTPICAGNPTDIQAMATGGSGAYTFSWSSDPPGFTSNLQYFTVSPSLTTTYTVTAYDGFNYSVSSVTVIVSNCSSLEGTLTYMNTEATPMLNASVLLKQNGSIVSQVTTNSSGHYLFQSPANGTYVLDGASTRPWGGVNAADALLILQHFVGFSLLPGLKREAADVDASGFVNATDALLTVRRFVNLIPSFPAGDWVFEKDTITITGTDNLTNDFKALCYGDVDGSYSPAAKTGYALSMENEGTININTNEIVDIPISIKEAAEIGSISLIFNIPDNSLVIDDVVSGYEGDLVYHVENGNLRIGWYSLQPMPLKAGDVLLTVRCRITNPCFTKNVCWTIDPSSLLTDENSIPFESLRLTMPAIQSTDNQFDLYQNSPNPFSDVTEISYYLPEKGQVSLVVTDLLGRNLMTVVDAYQEAGFKKESIHIHALAPGIYYYSLNVKGLSRDFSRTRQMIIVKL
ncbi:MAG: T9SS type A sorting domain-containing protein [Bacteroidetes bacterium]|nr:T9SS type A sorting domain-containing protein [Bacteroidota bacterium]